MGYFALSAITGCFEPNSGETVYHDVIFNDANIVCSYKKDIPASINTDWKAWYIVVCVFENYPQIFKFFNPTDRNNFFSTLPT